MAENRSINSRNTGWRQIVLLIAFTIFAIALRAWSVLTLAADPRIDTPTRDSAYYFDLARQIAGGGAWPQDPLFMGQLYPFLLSCLFRFAPPEVVTIQIFQSVLGLATLALIVIAARRYCGAPCAWLAAGIYILYGPILATESTVLMESVMLFLAAVALCCWPARRRRGITTFTFGLACGLLAVGRASFLLLPLIAVASLVQTSFAPKASPPSSAPASPASRLRAIFLSLLILIGTALPMTPQTIHQSRAVGKFHFLTFNGGMNLYVGNNHLARGIFSAPPEMDLNDDFTARRSASVLAGRQLTLPESSRFWRARALAEIKSDPVDFFTLLGRKALLFFAPAEIPQIYNFQILAARTPALKIAFIRFGYILPLALIGLFHLFRLRRRGKSGSVSGSVKGGASGSGSANSPPETSDLLTPALALIAVGWAQTIIFFATGRYRIDILPAFLLLSAVGLHYLICELRQKRFLITLLTAAMIAGLLFVPAGYPVAKARAYDDYYLGLKKSNEKAYSEALTLYRQAIAADPTCGEAWHGTGTALFHLQRYPEAIESYLAALQRMPRSAITHYALGLSYLQIGDFQKAALGFQQAVRINPRQPSYHYQLGNALGRLGNIDAAKQAWQTTLQLQPDHRGAREQLQRF